MIAALPMYDWPETRSANDKLWARLSSELQAAGITAPTDLTRNGNLEALWLSPNLLLAQTCSYPLETALRGKVKYVATPSYKVAGCEVPGHYRSVILKRGNAKDMKVPTQGQAHLPDWRTNDRLAVNGVDSMSGYHAIKRDAAAAEQELPETRIITGSHRASIKAVADGLADICAVDCVSWAIARQYEPAANQVFVAGWTKQRPGLPLITALSCSEPILNALIDAARSVLGAVVLHPATEF